MMKSLGWMRLWAALLLWTRSGGSLATCLLLRGVLWTPPPLPSALFPLRHAPPQVSAPDCHSQQRWPRQPYTVLFGHPSPLSRRFRPVSGHCTLFWPVPPFQVFLVPFLVVSAPWWLTGPENGGSPGWTMHNSIRSNCFEARIRLLWGPAPNRFAASDGPPTPLVI